MNPKQVKILADWIANGERVVIMERPSAYFNSQWVMRTYEGKRPTILPPEEFQDEEGE